jgi:serine/threonine protein kinase
MSQAAIDVGHTIGRYEIVSRLASGGMAEVWLAYLHGVEGFRRCVVLKTMLPMLARRPECVKMFINEAAIAARFNHPNIVSTFDLGCLKDSYFIAMEYIQGRSLRQLARRAPGGRVPDWVVLHSVAAACKGLQYMHDYAENGKPLGLVHCDVSPENIIVSFNGNVTLVDFGIATTTIGGTPDDPDLIKGKFRFIAPERIRGRTMDRRADVYALGVMLYELLTGTRPYRAETPYELLARAVAGGAPPPRTVCPDIPEELDRIVRKAMALSPDDRYAEASHLESDISTFLAAADQSHLQRELGAYVCSVFPDATDLPSAARPDSSERPPTAEPRSATRLTVAKAPAAAPAPHRPPAESDCSIELSAASIEELVKSTARPGEPFAPLPPLPPIPPLPIPTPPPRRTTSGVQRIDEREDDSTAPPQRTAFDLFAVRAPRPRSQDFFACGTSSSRDGGGRVSSHPFGTRSTPSPLPPLPPRDLDPASAKAAFHFEAGLRLYRERRYAAALAEWETAIALDPTHSAYRTNVRKLKSLLEGRR